MRSVSHLIVFCGVAVSYSNLSVAQWSVTNLHPADAKESRAYGIFDGLQTGSAMFGANNQLRAGVWSGSSSSWQSLHPFGPNTGFSEGFGISGPGGSLTVVGQVHEEFNDRASMWDVASGEWQNLHPPGDGVASRLFATDGAQHAGAVYFVINGFGVAHATLWDGPTVVDLDPIGSTGSEANGVFAGKQVGFAIVGSAARASLWSGSAGSWINLHPSDPQVEFSRAFAAHTGQQVGWAFKPAGQRASLWTGSASSWIDLTPTNALYARAEGVHLGLQVGTAYVGSPGAEHAVLWHGTAQSWEDLHTALTGSWGSTSATGVWRDATTIYVSGYGFNLSTSRFEALLWQRPDCYADTDASGQLGIDDFITFQTLFALGDPAADCDANGDLGIDDFICFQTLFAIGC